MFGSLLTQLFNNWHSHRQSNETSHEAAACVSIRQHTSAYVSIRQHSTIR